MNIAADEETNRLLDEIALLLCEKYSPTEAKALTTEYYRKFTDQAYCTSIGIPVQNDDFFHHESAGGMALRVHYYLGLKGNPDPHEFIKWRSNHYKNTPNNFFEPTRHFLRSSGHPDLTVRSVIDAKTRT